jgi:hypothetical protein
MTGGAHLGISAAELIRIEPRSMGIEAAAALRRVAGQAVTLGMAGHAGLDVLPRRDAVVEGVRGVRIMVSLAQWAS